MANDITVQNFKDFYERIKPYLSGGAPAYADALTVNEFLLKTTDWVTTTDYGYAYKYVIETTAYRDDSIPTWHILSANGSASLATCEEVAEGQKIVSCVVNSTGVTLYAIDLPSCDLTLFLKGGTTISTGMSLVFLYNDHLVTSPEIPIYSTGETFIEFIGGTENTIVSSSDSATVSADIVWQSGRSFLKLTCLQLVDSTITISFAAPSANITVKVENAVFGVIWDDRTTTKLTRTGASASFIDPVPYNAGMVGSPSSPFDNVYPWSEMEISSDPSYGYVVKIPKFYYQWVMDETNTDEVIGVNISRNQMAGYYVSPVHRDRGDGVGERPYVYVGRYHMSGDDKSTPGSNPGNGVARSTFRGLCHDLGNTVWQWDYAMLVTIWMLYLVEFADWDSRSMIGGGCSPSSSKFNTGTTDTIPYHTGTTATSISPTAYGACEYRNIEGLWDNVFDWVDGIRFNAGDLYIISDPSQFNDASNGTLAISNRPTSTGYITVFKKSDVTAYDWVIYPKGVSSNVTTIPNYSENNSNGNVLYHGGGFSQEAFSGMFRVGGDVNASRTSTSIGSRLMVLPTSFN